MVEVLTGIGFALLGGVLALVGREITERTKGRRSKRDAYRRLDTMIEEVSGSVDHGDAFEHKEDWHEELEKLAERDRSWLGELYEPVKVISWRIRDHSFVCAREDSYCCDELLLDLTLLQLEMLHRLAFGREESLTRASDLAAKAILYRNGTLTTVMGEPPLGVEQFVKAWKDGTLTVGDERAISRVWNRRRAESQAG